MNYKLTEEFISFVRAEYGLTVEAVESNHPDTFEKIFGAMKPLKYKFELDEVE